MSTKDTFEDMARNAWLAGLGSIESSLKVLGKSIDAAQEKSNRLYNELLKRGEEMQGNITDTKNDIEKRSKKFFGIGSTELQEKKLAELNATVDHLTTVVVKLIEKRDATSPSVKPVQQKAVKATPKTTSKTKATAATKKATIKAKPKAAAVKKTAAKKSVKSATKVSSKKAP
ncbi:hypothetical protein [Brumicola nitratireducens]|uniref:Uncharacterized protein n=1 Tax=Glaciecola nitratireducens (strain JCM 12485 / KCTC 12276 / FR1064) TaxID=1085623 RepID=G4QL23_GLANF|nr:hypothetical protein [Glaciecola nitratireducens]AEP29413.1 hypothetical protein GNIT_1289 [Glaciecola nitratireducens FR1064]